MNQFYQSGGKECGRSMEAKTQLHHSLATLTIHRLKVVCLYLAVGDLEVDHIRLILSQIISQHVDGLGAGP